MRIPDLWCKATDHIPEQIEMIRTLEAKGYTYRTDDGIYFEISRGLRRATAAYRPLRRCGLLLSFAGSRLR